MVAINPKKNEVEKVSLQEATVSWERQKNLTENKAELALENAFEKKKEEIEQPDKEKALVKKIETAPVVPVKTTVAIDYHAERAQAIDKILAEGLHEIFLQLDKKKQQEFKQTGEETVSKINALLNKTKVKLDKIVDLIRNWLRLIPGVNRFFLEQEAKIKADKIIRLKNIS